MEERRGRDEFHTRELHYCDRCKATSAFEPQLDAAGHPILVCIGDQRSPNPHPGCGKTLATEGIRRYYGDCMTCKCVRRAIKMPDGTFHCVACGEHVTNPGAAPLIM
jgi:hypothetical protein